MRRFFYRCLPAFFLLLWSSPVLLVGQRSPASRTNSADDWAARLKAKDDGERLQAARELGLVSPLHEKEACADIERVENWNARLDRSTDAELLVVHAFGICQTDFIVPFVLENGKWKPLPPIAVLAHYDEPRIRLLSLIERGVQEIEVSGQYVDWGTGIQQQNRTIYKLIDGKMRVVFDEPESLHFGSSPSTYDEYEKSSFSYVKREGGNGMPLFIMERRMETKGKRSILVFCEYDWKEELGGYRMVGADHQD